MSLSILNNVSALYAQNSLNSTQASLQNTLKQLSSGSRINSGADDAAGLAVADGLHANQAALNQSSQNATAGIGLLQTADGALSQVTNLLDRAVTLATESANGTLTSNQVSSANQEYQNILSQIGNIGSTTNFNSSSVFTSSATNIVVTDGTSSGLNTYADTIGALSAASVGTTAGTAIVSTALTASNIVTTQANAGSTRVGGQYVLAASNKTDTVSGQFSFTVGSTNAQQHDVNVAAGTTLSQLKDQLNSLASTPAFSGAGLTASINTAGALVITGPTTGDNVAANSVTFTNTALTDTLSPIAPTGTSVAGAAGTAASGSVKITGAAANDTFAGTIILAQGSENLTITIGAGSKSGLASDGATIQGQIAAAIAAQGSTSHFAVGTSDTSTNPVLAFTGSNNTTAITITGTLDKEIGSGVVADNAGVAGVAPTKATYTLSALSTVTDTFGAASTLTIGGEGVNLAGMTATAAANAISTDSVLSGQGITAAVTGGKLVISGKADGSAMPAVTTANTLTDVSSVVNPNLTAATVGVTNPMGSLAVATGSTVISMLSATDTLAGSLSVTVGTGGSAQTAALTLNSGNGTSLATQINQNASFKAANITAAYSAGKLTLSGPGGATPPTFTVNASTSLTESTVSTPGAGANFTDASVSQLTHDSAAAVLTTVTAAVADVAYQRGTIGANINQLTSASNVASSEQVNLTSAEESIRATNYGQAASDLSKYQILSQTGISALAQANSVQQEVLKLLQ